ncbi:aurora kinase A- and ninein-interacting protein [Labrus bergylta]|uniref:aurora kinase A- and ninein-interacting protein n=1 Tax=Labrus bergylta TaxID=56723 RepID=UPI0033139BA7
MKTFKAARKTPVQEECGVWLDTVQLKGKAKQKGLARPISKLLNPFTGGGGYNVAVALNFTQTKLDMPKTKQTSISTFFTPQHRVLNKMSTSEVPNMDPVFLDSASNTTTCTLTAPTPGTSGTKRRRELDHYSEAGLDRDKCETAVCWEQSESCTTSQNVCCEFEQQFEEINPTLGKKRLIATTSFPEDSQALPQAWSQDPLLTCSQYTEDDSGLTYHKRKAEENLCDSEPSFLRSLQSEEVFGALMGSRTATQKAFNSSQMDDEKENSRFLSTKSSSKHSTFSYNGSHSSHTPKKTKTASPPNNSPSHMWIQPEREEISDSQFKRRKQSVSPCKKRSRLQSCRAVDEDSLAMLFTQDSEGLRVIAHRGLKARSPLTDQSNRSSRVVSSSAFKSVEEDEEDEMLFTQDSQGNMVIKH